MHSSTGSHIQLTPKKVHRHNSLRLVLPVISMATAVERATCTMLDPPDWLSSMMDVVIMPDFLLKLADWMDWRTLTMLRGTNYGSSVTLPTSQPWHSIGALHRLPTHQVISRWTISTQSTKTMASLALYASPYCSASTLEDVKLVERAGYTHHRRALHQAFHLH